MDVKKRKKILFVNSCLADGGAERVLALLANEFSARDYEVAMVLVRGEKEDIYTLKKEVKCYRFKYNGTSNKIKILCKRILKLRSLIKAEKYDIVISFVYDNNLVTLLSTLGMKLPIILSERGEPRVRWKKRWKKILENVLYLRAKHLVFQTKMVQRMYWNQLQEKSSLIANPINEDLPYRHNGVRRNAIVAVGRLEEQKNFVLLLNAFAKFHKIYEDDILEIYGKGTLLEALKQKAKDLNIDNYVAFLGYVNPVEERMVDAEMYISSSNYEGISNTMLEALAMGVPTICTDCPVGGAALMIKNGVNGLLVPVNDVEAMYQAMLKIRNDICFANYLSENAVKVREKYSLKKIVDEWERIING